MGTLDEALTLRLPSAGTGTLRVCVREVERIGPEPASSTPLTERTVFIDQVLIPRSRSRN